MSNIMTFYLILMICVLVLVITVYPTLSERAKREVKKKRK